MTRLFTIGNIILFLFSGCLFAQDNKMELSFEQARQMLFNENNSLKIAEHEIDLAKSEHQRLNAFWFPHITATGAYVHMSNDIEVQEPLSQFTDPAVDWIHSVFPSEEFLTTILNDVGKNHLSVSLFPQNITSIDAIATFPLFTGGKRIYAGTAGKLMVELAGVNKEKTSADQQILLVETYYALRLGQKIVEVRQQTYDAVERHFQNAIKLESNGIITKVDRLYFQVSRDEAKRELQAAKKTLEVAQNTFKTVLKIEDENDIIPSSSLFINENLPDVAFFKELVKKNNYLVNGLDIQDNIQKQQLKVARSAYLPDIELFARQTLYANGIPKNLVPRTMVGGGFSWNIFDGLDREKKIKQAKINSSIFEIERDKIIDDMHVIVDKLYNQTQIALENVTALKTTVEMSNELVRARQKAYLEGVGTSTEVIDAELMLSRVKLATLMAYFEFDTGLINLLAITGMSDSFYQYSKNGKDESYIFN